MANFALKKEDSTISLESEFKLIADEISNLFEKNGQPIRPYRDPRLIYYSQLDKARQQSSLHRLKIFLSSITSTLDAGDQLSNNSRALWHAIGTLGFRPDSEVFSKLQDDDVIEVYDSQGTQIWRNFNYMKICSYSLEEIICHDWPTLYRRDPKITELLIQVMIETLSGQQYGPRFIDVDFHMVAESFSESQFQLHVRHDYICPLLGPTKSCDGFVITSKVKILRKTDEARATLPDLQLV